MGYKGLCILSWLYGIGLGGFQYSLKILALERIKLKHFSKAWGGLRPGRASALAILISSFFHTGRIHSWRRIYSCAHQRAAHLVPQ